MENSPILEVRNLHAGYGDLEVVRGIDLALSDQEILAMVGPNGSGKSTALRAIVGAIGAYGGSVFSGEVEFWERDIRGEHPHQLLQDGLAFVPDGGRVFPSLSTRENLLLSCQALNQEVGKDRIGHILDAFPILEPLLDRQAGALSIGESQILALARTLLVDPDVMLLDEPTAGLSHNYAQEIFTMLDEISESRGILVVEQNARQAIAHADRVVILQRGEKKYHGPAEDFEYDQVTHLL